MSYKSNYYKPKTTKKSKWVTIAITVAVILVVCALFGLIPNLFNHSDGDYKRIYVGWNVGGLTDAGMFDSEVKDTMVSDAIDIDGGFLIKPDFESGLRYSIYLYDKDDLFLNVLNQDIPNNLEYTYDTILNSGFEDADHYRIVLHPDDPNNIIDVFEKQKYSNKLEIYRAPLDEEDTSEE